MKSLIVASLYAVVQASETSQIGALNGKIHDFGMGSIFGTNKKG